jgi:GNAT superfamily N-acetyltransferase
MNTIFREADLEKIRDNEAIVTLLNEFMFRNHPDNTQHIDISIIQKLKKLGTTKIYLCELGNDIFGIAVCFVGFSTYRQRELLNIHDFFIQKEHQGKGIGTKFLEFIEKECIRNNFCRITLEVYNENKIAMKLYEKIGFLGNRDAEENHIIYAMKKDL